MELGGFETVVQIDHNLDKRPHSSKSRKKPNGLTTKKNIEDIELFCNKCKCKTKNAKEVTYNYNTNVSKWIANSVCSKCYANKSVFIKKE